MTITPRDGISRLDTALLAVLASATGGPIGSAASRELVCRTDSDTASARVDQARAHAVVANLGDDVLAVLAGLSDTVRRSDAASLLVAAGKAERRLRTEGVSLHSPAGAVAGARPDALHCAPVSPYPVQ